MKVVFVLLAMVISSIYGGFALSVLWEWHIVKLGVPSISLANAIGIYSIVSIMTKVPSTEDLKDGEIYKSFISGIVYVSILFTYGYIATMFM